MQEIVQSNAATAEESAAASEELSAQSEQLKENVGFFRTEDYNTLELPKEKPQAKKLPAAVRPRISLDDGNMGKY